MQRVWDQLPNYDESSLEVLAGRSGPTLRAAKNAAFTASTGFYGAVTGRPAPRLTVADVAVDPALRDPFIATWRALKQGRSYDAAVAAGRERLDAVVANLANSTARQTGDLYLGRAGITAHGWERIPDPDACDWCQLVAGQTYKSADSADFGHDRCACTAIPNI